MTDVAIRQDTNLPVFQEDPTGGRLVAWAKAASAANQLARSLVFTQFVPAAFQPRTPDDAGAAIGNATAAIIMGDELGLSPLASLRSIFVIHGQPAMYARTMVALAQSHGHSMWTEKTSDAEVIVCGQRRGSERVERASWTVARARMAGYTSNKKYQSNPQEMLYAKASAEVARKIAADVLAGIPATVEDLELEPSAESEPATVAPKATRMSRAKPAPPQPTEPDLAPPEPEPVDAEPADEPSITPAQMKHLHALFGDLGLGNDDRDLKLQMVADALGFEVASSKDLSTSQASLVIDALKLRVGNLDA